MFRHANNSNCNFGGTTVDPVKPVSAGSAAAAAAAAPVSSSSNSTSGSGAKGVVDMWLPEDTTGTFLSCPTRLVIRRRAASSASSSTTTTTPNHPANGTTTETHIYAIRYPEGTPDQVISEQVIPRPESARQQEQYPTTTKKQLFKAHSSDATDAAVVDVSDTTLNPIDSAVGHPATTGSSVAVQSLPSAVVVRCSLSDGLDVYSPIAMGTVPRQEGRYSRKSSISLASLLFIVPTNENRDTRFSCIHHLCFFFCRSAMVPRTSGRLGHSLGRT